MAEKLCDLSKNSGKIGWTFLGETDRTSSVSGTPINMSAIPADASEILIEMGWMNGTSRIYAQSHILPKSRLNDGTVNASLCYSIYSPGTGGAFFLFMINDGDIRQFASSLSAISKVYADVYYR